MLYNDIEKGGKMGKIWESYDEWYESPEEQEIERLKITSHQSLIDTSQINDSI